MLDRLKTAASWVFLVVLVLFWLTHSCNRVGCFRYPGASELPGIVAIEAAWGMAVLVLLAIAGVGRLRS